MLTLSVVVLTLSLMAAAMVAAHNLRDGLLKETVALPNGAGTVYCDPIDTGPQSGRQSFLAACEFLLTAPALAVAELADGATMTYSIQTDNDAAFGSPTDLMPSILIQTGAGGAGAAADTVRFRLPSDTERYVRVRAVNSAAGDASDKSLTFELLF